MSTPQEAMQRLSDLAQELDQRSLDLAKLERELEPLRTGYENHIAAFELVLWERHTGEEGEKFPPERVRERMALRAMDPEIRGRHDALVARRRRIEQRIRDIKAQVDAQRSILSALKTEMEATQ